MGQNHTKPYDLAVIGAGSAGFSAAITAAEAGAQVALIGGGAIGGTCVNVGCIPSKTLIRAMSLLHQKKTAQRFSGIEGHADISDWQQLMAQKNKLVARLQQAKYIGLLPAYENISYIEGQAKLLEGGVQVGPRFLETSKVIIATGSSATIPDIRGLDKVPYLTSTEALNLPALPHSIIILGAGYIGCELAQMFARAGSYVTLLYRQRLLPDAEPEISEALANYLLEDGIEIQRVGSYSHIKPSPTGISVTVETKAHTQQFSAQHLLISAGRMPNSKGLGLAPLGITTKPSGAIVVDQHMQTSRHGVYAAGDVTGRDPFVYMAAYGAKIAAKNAIGDDQGSDLQIYDNRAVPAVVFTDPQVASVGLLEAQAKALGFSVTTSVIDLEDVPRAVVACDTRGLIKLVADGKTGRLLGAHILAPEGADSIQTAALALRQQLTVRDMAEMIFPYLTTVEGLKLAALAFDKDVNKLSCCAG